MKLAPIALFVYNRLSHARQTIGALQKNKLASESDLFIFSDGAKNINNRDQVAEVRQYLKTVTGFKSIVVEESLMNRGLADSIIYGVSQLINKFGKIIVLEDDMLTSKFFLKYMNEHLEYYFQKEEVISIHGFSYPIDELPRVFFLRGADCWGWATWKRGWDLFEPNGQTLLNQLIDKKLTREFDFSGSNPYTQMLVDQINGKNNSWAIRWYAAAFLANKLTLYPGVTLVKNIGFDDSGTHCGNGDPYKSKIIEHDIPVLEIPVIEDQHARMEFTKFFNKINKQTLFSKIKSRVKKLIKK